MDEIKEGEYIRFGYGEIGIVKYYNGINIGIITQYGETEISSGVDKIAKRPLDLIEVGDYVNGERVTNIMDNEVGTEIGRFIAKEHIDTILTHEMYEQNCYKVGVEYE